MVRGGSSPLGRTGKAPHSGAFFIEFVVRSSSAGGRSLYAAPDSEGNEIPAATGNEVPGTDVQLTRWNDVPAGWKFVPRAS